MTEFASCRDGARGAKQIKVSDFRNVFDFSSRAPSYGKDPFRNCRRTSFSQQRSLLENVYAVRTRREHDIQVKRNSSQGKMNEEFTFFEV